MANLVGNPIITNAGRTALLAGEFAIANIQLGADGGWTPSPTSNWLWDPEKVLTPEVQVETVDGGVRLHVAAIDESDSAYTVREFALRDESGAALAIHSQPEPIASKAASSTLVLSIDLAIADATEDAIEVGDTNFLLPAATEQTTGIVRRATWSEAIEGASQTTFVSPRGLQEKLEAAFPTRTYVLRVPVGAFVGTPREAWSLPPDRTSSWEVAGGVPSNTIRLLADIHIPPRTVVRGIRFSTRPPEGELSPSLTVRWDGATFGDLATRNLSASLVPRDGTETRVSLPPAFVPDVLSAPQWAQVSFRISGIPEGWRFRLFELELEGPV